mgnify:CR=1 FL=1
MKPSTVAKQALHLPSKERAKLAQRLIESLEDLSEAEADKHLREHGSIKVPVLRLSDKLKTAASRRGLPLFSAGLPFKFTPVDGDPFDDKERR